MKNKDNPIFNNQYPQNPQQYYYKKINVLKENFQNPIILNNKDIKMNITNHPFQQFS